MLERFKVPAEDRVYIRPEKMRVATETVFKSCGVSDDNAALSADVLMLSDMRGCETHGVSNMLRRYVQWYDEGLLNPTPNIRITRESDATATVDADRGLGLQVAPKAMEIAIEKADKFGMGSVAVSGNNSGHVGMLAYHSMMAMERDMIGVTVIAGDSLSAVPTNGAEKRFATNPWAYAVPARDMPPFVFDIATTQVAGNKLALAKRVGSPLEPNWIAHTDGTPWVGDPQLPDDRADYHQLPMGGIREQGSHKGYGFAAVAEILTQVLSGTGASFLSRGTMCHWFHAYKIEAFTDLAKFKDDMDDFLQGLADTPPAPGHDRVLYPGLPEHEETQLREREGIPYHREVIDWFHQISDTRNLNIELT